MSEKSDRPTQKYVVIGNGFDLNLGLRSSYNQFIEAIQKDFQLRTPKEIYEFNSLFIQSFDGERLNWSDFETVFENQVLEINQQKFLKEDEARRKFLIQKLNNDLENLENDFYQYLSEIYEQWEKQYLQQHVKDKKRLLNPLYKKIFESARVLSFNYTDSVAKIIQREYIENCELYQLHGRIKDNNILFGGGFSGTDKVEQISIDGSMDNDKLIRTKKNRILVDTREKYQKELESLDDKVSIEVFVLGHSVDGSDLSFLSELFGRASKIYLFYFGEDYLPKLQSVSKKLGKNIAEKIFLVPFFDVLVSREGTPSNYIKMTADLTQQVEKVDTKRDVLVDTTQLQKLFDFSIPSGDIFSDIIVNANGFLFDKLPNLNISHKAELETLLILLQSISVDRVSVQDKWRIRLENIRCEYDENGNKTDDPLDNLFTQDIFQNGLHSVESITISNCEFTLDSFLSFLSKTSVSRLILNNNVIHMEKSQEWDLAVLSESVSIQIFDNQFRSSIRLFAGENIKTSDFLRQISIYSNENVSYDFSIYHFARLAKSIHLHYPMDRVFDLGEVKFSKLENAILLGDGDSEPFQNIRFNDTIERVELENIPYTQSSELESGREVDVAQPLSNLFTSKVLPNLKHLSFSNCGVIPYNYMEEPIDIHVNFFNDSKPVEILFDGVAHTYENLLFRGGLGGVVSSNIEAPIKSEEVISTKVIKITPEIEKRIASFSNEFSVSEELLSDYIQNLGKPDKLLEPFRKRIIQETDYASYADEEGIPLKPFQAKQKLGKKLECFIKELQGEKL